MFRCTCSFFKRESTIFSHKRIKDLIQECFDCMKQRIPSQVHKRSEEICFTKSRWRHTHFAFQWSTKPSISQQNQASGPTFPGRITDVSCVFDKGSIKTIYINIYIYIHIPPIKGLSQKSKRIKKVFSTFYPDLSVSSQKWYVVLEKCTAEPH